MQPSNTQVALKWTLLAPHQLTSPTKLNNAKCVISTVQAYKMSGKSTLRPYYFFIMKVYM